MADATAKRQQNRGNVILLGTVSFINDTASKIILPILPLFIIQLGGSGLAVGIVSGLGDSMASLAKLFAGYGSDRLGRRKPFVFFGYLLSSIAKLLLATASSWHHVLALRVAERLGKGIRSAPRDAILAGSTEKRSRGKGFGLHRAMDSAGALLGTLTVLGLYWFLNLGFEPIFLIAGTISFLCLFPLLFVRDTGDGGSSRRPSLHFRALPERLRRFLLIAFIYSLANFSYMFLVLRAESAFEEHLAVVLPVLLYGVFQLSYTLFALPAGMLSDHVGRRRVLLAGYVLFTIICAGFIWAGSLTVLLILFLLYGLSNALVNANERALVADLATETERGTALGAYHMITSLAALPAGLLAGLLWDLRPAYTFAAGALLSILAVAMLASMLRKDPGAE